jgi:hypothetical protein
MRKPRVFISHVNGDASSEAIWPELAKSLAAKGFEVLVDRAMLRAGDLWRAEIYGWIGLCDAAVVLISKQATDDPSKHWVARETTCLVCRRYQEPSLKIIPVFLDGVTRENLGETERFRDLKLPEFICVEGGQVETIIEGLKDLQPMAETPLIRLANQVRGVLAEIHPIKIQTVLETCNVDLEALSPQSDQYLQLALSMLTMDVAKLPDLLAFLIRLDPPRRDSITSIKNLLLANWVEMEAARGVLEEGVKKTTDLTRRALLLNAPEERMAELYALRAFPGVQPGWKLLRLDWVFGDCADLEDAKQQLIEKIEKAIEDRVIVEVNAGRPDPKKDRQRRLDLCRRLAQKAQPVFITAMPGAAPDDVLRHAIGQYDFATFLLRSEVETADARALAPDVVRPLTPQISADRYAAFGELSDELADKLRSASVGG